MTRDNTSHTPATCGPGVRRRQVQCKVFSQRYGAVINQPSAVCKDRRPRDTTICNLGVCRAARPVPDAFTWRFSGYGPCSASCAGGVRYPLFTCVNVRDYRPVLHEYCDRVPKPALPTRNCNSGPCPPRWHTFEYGPCSVSCGGGVRIRPVQCVQGVIGSEQFAILPGSICPPPAPSNRVPCNLLDCSPEWAPSEWSKCSVTCGDGVRTRSLGCKQLLYKTHSRVERHLSACNRSTKPSTRETCSLAACPTVAPRRPSRHIVIDRSTYVQLKPQKKVQVLVGGRGVFFPGTVVSVRCTVKRFPRRNVRWRHNGKYVRSKGRIKARNGVLHIRRSRAKDAGLYTCVASNLTADIAIGFQSYDEATEKFRLRVEYIAKNSLFMQRLKERRARHRIKSWKVFTLPYLLDKIGLASIPLGYFAGNWSACSKTCGGAGLMYRDIQCELVQDAYYLQVDDEYCLEKGLTPPIESRDCGYQECPHWEVGPWSECTSNICLRSGVGAITRSLYCVSYGQLFPYHMCNASETPPNQKECPRENCYATWSATSWSECSRTCGGKGVQTRALQCVWITNKQPAGINCRRLHRPSVSRTCTSPPCSQTVCQDESSYCSLIPMLRLCHLRQYRTECCLSCKFTLLDSKYLNLAKKHVRQRSRDN
ncbi:Protein madd-4 [Lamellibrachia satsuma]|nr:Protein madd-4 [Lamellibrachia satsuma]